MDDLAELDLLVDRMLLRLKLTRDSLKTAIGNEFSYQHVSGAIEAAVNEAFPEPENGRSE